MTFSREYRVFWSVLTLATGMLGLTSAGCQKQCTVYGYVWNDGGDSAHTGVPVDSKLKLSLHGKTYEAPIEPLTGSYVWSDAPVGSSGTAQLGATGTPQPLECYPYSVEPTNFRFTESSVLSHAPPPKADCVLWGYVIDSDSGHHKCPPHPDAYLTTTLTRTLNKHLSVNPQSGLYVCDDCQPGSGTATLTDNSTTSSPLPVVCYGSSTQANLEYDTQANHDCTALGCEMWGYVTKNGSLPPSGATLTINGVTGYPINDSTGKYDCTSGCSTGSNSATYVPGGGTQSKSCFDSITQQNLAF